MRYTAEYLTADDYDTDEYEGYSEADFLAHWPDEAYLPTAPNLTPPF